MAMCKQLQHGHSNGNAHLHLLLDNRAVEVVGKSGVDFDASVHWAWMHNDHVVGRSRQFGEVESVTVKVFALRGYESALHALRLKPQHHYYVGILEAAGHVVAHFDAESVRLRRQQSGRRHHPYPVSDALMEKDVGPGDSAMQYVAADSNSQAPQTTLSSSDCKGIKQRLGRMLVRAVSGVDDAAAHLVSEQGNSSGTGMAADQEVWSHSVESQGGVDKGFALLYGGVGNRKADDVGSEPFSGKLETGARAGGVFEKEIDLGETAQDVRFHLPAAVALGMAVCKVENLDDVLGRELLDAEQMGMLKHKRSAKSALPAESIAVSGAWQPVRIWNAAMLALQ